MNETRPLSLVHDIWGFINAVAGKLLGGAIELSQVLDNDIMAYRRGRSAEDVAKTYICLLEEANETCEPVILISEDEEKFFDRINLETQAANMIACGMPEQGWLELKWKI